MYRVCQKHVVERLLKPAFAKVLSRENLDDNDRRMAQALQRIFIDPPPQTEDPEDEFDFVLIRVMFNAVVLVSVLKAIIILLGGWELSAVLNMFLSLFVALFFFGLFNMLYFEMKETGFMPFVIAVFSFVLGLWSAF